MLYIIFYILFISLVSFLVFKYLRGYFDDRIASFYSRSLLYPKLFKKPESFIKYVKILMLIIWIIAFSFFVYFLISII